MVYSKFYWSESSHFPFHLNDNDDNYDDNDINDNVPESPQ